MGGEVADAGLAAAVRAEWVLAAVVVLPVAVAVMVMAPLELGQLVAAPAAVTVRAAVNTKAF